MKYTLVYRERPDGYNWFVMNNEGLYAAWQGNIKKYIRSWRTSAEASDYMEIYRRLNLRDLVWAPWPTDKPTPIKPVTTAASYKPAHGGYPDAKPLVWPVIPQTDDYSNEEPNTIPEALVQAVAQRVFIVRLRNALTK